MNESRKAVRGPSAVRRWCEPKPPFLSFSLYLARETLICARRERRIIQSRGTLQANATCICDLRRVGRLIPQVASHDPAVSQFPSKRYSCQASETLTKRIGSSLRQLSFAGATVFTVSALIPGAYPRFFVRIISRHVACDLSALVGTNRRWMLNPKHPRIIAHRCDDERRSETIGETITKANVSRSDSTPSTRQESLA